MTLALLAIMLNEEAMVARWAAGWRRVGGVFDEVVVVDGGSSDGTVQELQAAGVRVVVRPFPGDFSDQRNFAVDQTTASWIFELDADEVPSVPLLGGLRKIAEDADAASIDAIGIPRLNFHDHILQPGPGHRGLDFQYRLHRRYCRWHCREHKRVHEEVTGYKGRLELSIGDGHLIQHLKSQARFDERNELYRRMEMAS